MTEFDLIFRIFISIVASLVLVNTLIILVVIMFISYILLRQSIEISKLADFGLSIKELTKVMEQQSRALELIWRNSHSH